MPVLPCHDLPFAPIGARIGLFGGSFDPAHGGHLNVSDEALKRLGLDQVWWLVSPSNPLKADGPAPLAVRMAHARQLVRDPRVKVTDIETRLCTRFTHDTLAALLPRFGGRHFVWVMGADNLASLHRWENWRSIMETVPIAVLARPGQQRAALSSPAARAYRAAQVPSARARSLATLSAPAWCYLRIPMRDISSSRLRAEGEWKRG